MGHILSNFITVYSSVRRLSNSQFSIVFSLTFTISPKWLLPWSSPTAICDAPLFQCKVRTQVTPPLPT